MTKIAIVYYSTYGHIVQLAEAVKEGVEKNAGVTATIYQVEETLPQDVLDKMYAPAKKDYPIATPDVLKEADGILFGMPTRFGAMPAQIKALVDATGGLWAAGGLVGKPAGIFFSTGTLGGGQETTVMSSLTFLTHHGMSFVPLGYRSPLLFNLEEVHGGSPWGAGTLAGADGSRQPSQLELDIAKVQGETFAQVAQKLSAPDAAPVVVETAAAEAPPAKATEPVKQEQEKVPAAPATEPTKQAAQAPPPAPATEPKKNAEQVPTAPASEPKKKVGFFRRLFSSKHK